MLDQINGKLVTIDAIDSIQTGCGFSDSQIMSAGNCSISQKGGLAKTLTLKLESKAMLTTNIDITDHLINRQIEVVKVDIINIKSDDINVGKKIETDR